MKSERRVARLTGAIRQTQLGLGVVLENIHDPHNVSAIFRTCDAVGIRKVDLVYTEEHFPKIGKKSSASAYKWVEKRTFKSVGSCYDTLKSEGFIVCASVVGGDSRMLYDLDLTAKVALVFGNEHRGVSAEAASGADIRFQIPMLGMVQSLNVSVACAIVLYEALRQRLSRGVPDDLRMSEEVAARMLEEWLKK